MSSPRPSIYYITSEPRGAVYRELLQAAVEVGSTFGFVLRSSAELTGRARALQASLAPYLRASDQLSEWPGTRLVDGGYALVNRYTFDGTTCQLLTTVTGRLYEWLHPQLPEDLFIERADGNTWLSSVAHEREAYLHVGPDEAVRVARSVTGLEIEGG
jgi:hypothetical protein